MGRTYPNEIRRILHMPGGDVGKACRSVAMDIAAEAQRQAIATFGWHPGDMPRTGKLARGYRVEVIPGTNKFIVVNKKKYAAAMELGARAHEIHARRVTYLQFRGRDGVHRRVKMVRHPGSVARHTLAISGRIVMRRRFGVG